MTNKELEEKQSWNLNQKIDHSLYIIDAFLSKSPEAVVAYSGGIDSTVMLALVRLIDKDRKAIFANTTNEFSEIAKFVRDTDNVEIVHPIMNFQKVVEQYGFPLVSKKVARMIHDCRHPTPSNENTRRLYLTGVKTDGTISKQFIIPKKYRHLLDADFDITSKCCDILKKAPMKDLSRHGVFIGTMAENSSNRRATYLKTGCIDVANNVCKPMSIWLKDDIWSFTRQNNIKYCDIYDKGEESTGCAYCGFGLQFDQFRFKRLCDREPKRYKQMMGFTNNGVTFEEAINITFKGKVKL